LTVLAAYTQVVRSAQACNHHGQPLGVQCRACERHVLVPLDKIGAKRPSCLFVKRDEAEAWIDG